ncbi:MAG TPA: DMT family transporter [Gemmatimonadaceae bacterium]|nr:DMT family transporter [Gemmatimonadaceae bacterium]
MGKASSVSVVLYTALALLAFAANSILSRIALHDGAIDAASFSTIRLIAGAVTLVLVSAASPRTALPVKGSWISAAMLFLYAVPFSFAYTLLSVATGALILFGCVQITMMGAAWRSGERPPALQWIGLSLAFGGLVYLVLPGLEAPSPAGAALMALAGFAWGVYSLRGRGATNPLAQTTSNFVRSIPFALVISLVWLPRFSAQRHGVLLAVASGAVASGLGYVVWYRALRGLTAVRAAVVQLFVPILAGVGGVIFLAEEISARLVLATILVLGGIALALYARDIKKLLRRSFQSLQGT